ncbi:MAG: hypothetical protein HY456_01830 [Parcubacteria group bacterium]|nr:hypothetical protein [Parcubacteria group bacterium]
MISKTPQFDRALEEYFSKLELDEKGGQWRTCRFSGEKFYVRPEDVEFYRRIGVPLPTLGVAERWRRLLAYQNVHNLFYITSAYSGKQIIAAYPPTTPYKIYEHQIWFSDKWDPLEFGRPWDNKRDFFDQFAALQKEVPRPNLVTDTTNTGSDFTNTSTHLKNCYLTFNTISGENLYYFDCCDGCLDCIDCEGLWNCNTCYMSQILYDSYRCFFCEQSRNCLKSYFLFDCRNCQNCFMSSNLRNKQYCFRNQQLTKEEYERRIAGVYLGDHRELKKYTAEFSELKKNAKYKPDNNFRSVNSYGDFIDNSRNCYWSNLIIECDNVNYSEGVGYYKDSHDIVGGAGGELCYELMTISTSNNYGCKFSSQVDNCRDVEYCDLCRNCHDCFGCIGLANKSFCIFNRQYAEEEYWKLLDGIKSSMLAVGEYVEFFPPRLMPVPYKLSLISSYPGFRDFNNATRYGYDASDTPPYKSEAAGAIVNARELPNDVKDVNNSVLDKIIFDEKNEKYFRLTAYELDFYRRHRLALPREHPLARLMRFREIYDLRLTFYAGKCAKCGASIQSVHNPAQYENIYCEACYSKEVV